VPDINVNFPVVRYNANVSFNRYLLVGFLTAAVFLAGFYLGHFLDLGENSTLLSPFSTQEPELPLLQYTIPNLAKKRYVPGSVTVNEVLEDTPDFTSYLFSYTSTGRKITGQLNVPKQLVEAEQPIAVPVIVMIRGFVPEEIYTTGLGTKSAAAVFAQNGYVTFAPDFLGFGGSDPEPTDVWEGRFIKPINVIELIAGLKAQPTLQLPLPSLKTIAIDPAQLGLWAHSNGGQIALTTLEILGEPIPTTLWAPVTVPFPYSILFYTDENDDEGKEARAWISLFEKNYDAREFSLTKYLDRLTGSIQLHHGTADEAALLTWSDEFVAKIEAENNRRENSEIMELPAIDLTYLTYPGADHNLQPSWNTVVQRDVSFFNTHLTE
jgi:pimeloyl-ACP methyl ester carboxylesterase